MGDVTGEFGQTLLSGRCKQENISCDDEFLVFHRISTEIMPNSSDKSNVKTISLDGDKMSDEQFRKTSKLIVKQIKSFNAHFTQFLDQERKSTKELWNQVVMYNNVNRWFGAD